MTCWALVPLKERSACKTRLAPLLSPPARIWLVHALLDHVVGTLRNTPGIDHITVVSPERDHIAGDIKLVAHERVGLNEDLTYALGRAAGHGATRAILIPADLPLLDPSDVIALLAAAKPTSIAIAPDRHERGTNALALDIPPRLTLAFGDDSFPRHLARCRDQGWQPAVVRRAGFSFDVDEIEDLRHLRSYPRWARLMGVLSFSVQ